MSYRIHRAVGWGLTPDQFKTFVGDDEDLYEKLIKVKELVIGDSEYSAIFNSIGIPPLSKDLLKGTQPKKRETWVENKQRLRSAEGLYESVSNPDDTLLHLFYPDVITKVRLYRWDDDLDYIFARYDREGNEVEEPCYDLIKKMRLNPYPFANDIMNKTTGESVPWDNYHILEGREDWCPRPPIALEWWLKKLNVMSDEGIRTLRPYICNWWC